MEGKTSWQFSKSLSLEKINFLEQTQNTDSRKTNWINVANTRCTPQSNVAVVGHTAWINIVGIGYTLYMSVVDAGCTT